MREDSQGMGRSPGAAADWFRVIGMSCLDGVIVIDGDGRICEFNSTAEKIFGMRSSDVVGRSMEVIVPERYRQPHRDGMARFLRTGEGRILNQRVQIEGLHADGHEVPIELGVAPIPDPDGMHFCAFVRDMSAAVKAEAIEARRSLLQSVISEMTAELMGHPDLESTLPRLVERIGEMTDVGQAMMFRCHTGLTGVDRVSRSAAWRNGQVAHYEGLRDVDWLSAQGTMRRLHRRESIVVHDVAEASELEAFYGDRGVRSVLIVPVLATGQLDSFLVLEETRRKREWLDHEVEQLQGLTLAISRAVERTQSERELHHAGERLREALACANSASKAKGEFLANMSHEIRTPMTAIVGYSDLLLRPSTSPDEARKWCALIHRNANFLLGLINGILDLSKIEARQLSLSSEEIDLVDAVDETVSALQWLAESKSLDLSVEYGTEVPQAIVADPVRLRQVLTNLVQNALKFTDAGQVRVVVGFHGDADSTTRELRIGIHDTGIGIPADQVDELFSTFTQVHGDQTRYGGTGLGLAISRQLALLMKGDLRVQSEVGVGSTFELSIPVEVSGAFREIRSNRGASGAVASLAAQPDVAGVRVLLVDDNPDNRSIFTLILEDAGVTLATAVDGQEACDSVQAAIQRDAMFDLVLMDMHMPVMDGIEATRTLRKRGVTAPIVALTAASTSEDARRCLAAGCTAFLTKPIRPDQLLAAVVAYGTGESASAPVVAADGPKIEAVVPLQSELPDRPEFRELIKSYRASMRDTLAALTNAIEDEDRARLKVLTHKIKGSAGCYGFSTVSVLAGSCDQALRGEEPLETVRDALEDLSQMLERLVAQSCDSRV